MDIRTCVPVHEQVEAVQVTAANLNEVIAWIRADGQHDVVVGVPAKPGLAGMWIDIETKEGRRRAMIGDWVVRDGLGEFYPLPQTEFPRRLQTVV